MKTQRNDKKGSEGGGKTTSRSPLTPMAYSLMSHSRGFTILFAVLVGSILLAIGLAIFDITVRELKLSSIAREAQLAVYAADSGAECALYWSLPAQGRVTLSTSTAVTFYCNGQTLPTDVDGLTIGGRGYEATSTVRVAYEDGCAEVEIGVHLINPDTQQIRTIINSRGYNVCDEADPRRVERAFRVVF